VDIIGSGGQQLGRLRLGLRVAKPIDRLLLQQQQQRQEEPEAAAGQQLEDNSDAALVLQQAAEQVGTLLYCTLLAVSGHHAF
jgi:hypothetical protein